MTTFHAVMIDETGCEFGTSVTARSRTEAFKKLREDYPESRCDQLESPEDTACREAAMYDDINRGIYRNEDGSIDYVEPGYDEPEEEDDSEERFTDHADEPFFVEDAGLWED